MKPYSQRDKRWGKLKIGKTNLTMDDFGCYVTAVASIDGRTPDVVLDILNRNNCFDGSGLLDNEQAAKVLGFESYEKTTKNPLALCIACIDYSPAPGVQTHFVVWLGNGNVMDTWDGKIKANQWAVMSYRLFKAKDAPEATPEGNKAIIRPTLQKEPTLWERIYAWIRRISFTHP